MMSYFYAVRSVTEDRDLSRAAAERSLMWQALSERQEAAQTLNSGRLPTRLLRYLRLAPRSLAGPEPRAGVVE